MNPFRWPYRAQALAGFLCCMGLLGYALYLQHQMFLDPCPLCILQRIAFMVMAAGFLLAAVHGPVGKLGRSIYAGVVSLGAAAGVSVAGRHLYLQGLPADEVPACSALGLDYMLEAFPLRDVLVKVFTGSGECAKIDWTFLGISMPGWTLVWYVLLSAGFLLVSFRRPKGGVEGS